MVINLYFLKLFLIYQLFDYSMMKYMKYEITLPEDEKHEVKIEDKKYNYKLE